MREHPDFSPLVSGAETNDNQKNICVRRLRVRARRRTEIPYAGKARSGQDCNWPFRAQIYSWQIGFCYYFPTHVMF